MVNKVNCSVDSVGYKINQSAVNTPKAADVLVAGKNVKILTLLSGSHPTLVAFVQ